MKDAKIVKGVDGKSYATKEKVAEIKKKLRQDHGGDGKDNKDYRKGNS